MKRNPYKYTEEVLSDAVKDVFSYRQLINKLGKRPSGGLQYHLKKLIEHYNINVSHFTGQAHNRGKKSKYRHTKESFIERVLIYGSGWSSHAIKLKLFEFGIKKKCCEKCNTVTWFGEELSLHLDHINGDHKDNRIKNLRVLCPNCHSQTSTYCKTK